VDKYLNQVICGDCLDVHAAAILGEEAGEVLQAALDNSYFGGDENHIIAEAAQAGAMAIRVIEGIIKYKGRV